MKNGYKYFFSIFTPTYNRVDTIHRVYESITEQSFKDFEWVIVDNGDDGTQELVNKYIKEAGFPIRYYQQSSKGLHLAYNEGIDYSKGFLYFPLHSDDALTPNALQIVWDAWDSIPEDERNLFCGITGRCVNQNLELIGFNLPQKVFDSDHREIRYRYRVWYEMAGCYRTDVMRQFRFPDLGKDIRFVPEGWVWGQIAAKYRTRFLNQPVRIYTLPDSSKESLMTLTNPEDISLQLARYFKYCLEDEISWFWISPWVFFRLAVHYSRYSYHMGVSACKQFSQLKGFIGKLLWIGAAPVGYLMHIHDKKIRNTDE